MNDRPGGKPETLMAPWLRLATASGSVRCPASGALELKGDERGKYTQKGGNGLWVSGSVIIHMFDCYITVLRSTGRGRKAQTFRLFGLRSVGPVDPGSRRVSQQNMLRYCFMQHL
jgi:hypothetical protein